jgi:hypothetical protein
VKKTLGLIVALMLCIGLTGVGSFAYFVDVEGSPDNQMSAGTLDLKTDDADGVTQTIYASSLKRGDSVSGNITLKNSGDTDAALLDVFFDYIENDDTPNATDMSANATAAVLEVTSLHYDGSSLLSSISDNNTNGYPDIQDLAVQGLPALSGLNSIASKDFDIGFKLKETTDNAFQGDGITVTITFVLNQWGS